MNALVVVLLTLFAQEIRPVYRNFAACYDYGTWEAQETVLHADEDGWLEFVRALVAKGDCWITRDKQMVEIVGVRGGHAVRVKRHPEDRPWFLGREAIVP